MSMTITGTTIKLTRGDSAYISVVLTDQDGEAYETLETDEVRFALKNRGLNDDSTEFEDDTVLLTKDLTYDEDDDAWMLHLLPEDTADLGFGTYVYDIQLSTTYDEDEEANTDDFTFIANAKFKLTPEVD